MTKELEASTTRSASWGESLRVDPEKGRNLAHFASSRVARSLLHAGHRESDAAGSCMGRLLQHSTGGDVMNFENEPNDAAQTSEDVAQEAEGAPTEASASGAYDPTASAERPRKRRGFAAMDPRLVSELATRGGKAAHRAGTAHEFTSEEARIAGRKGGLATHAKRRARLLGGNGTPPVVS
jgi:general stress protein YciG